MSNCHVVIPDAHAKKGDKNDRAIWLGRLICDLKPDTVVDLGDSADMPSLCSYDKGTKSFEGRRYKDDINAYLDFQDKLWTTVRSSKKRLPRNRVRLIGNHEQRIERAINVQPTLEGVIGYSDLQLDRYYTNVVGYVGSTPGTVELDGIIYAHYLTSGVAGRPISGEHLAYTLLTKKFQSCTVGHNHTLDYCTRTNGRGEKIMGLCAGVFNERHMTWAGEMNKLWSRGIVIKRNVDRGVYDLEWVSYERLRKEYSR